MDSKAKLAIIGLVAATGIASLQAGTPAHAQSGAASWYGPGFQGRRTANGERFNTHAYTAAHRRLPFGTRVRVTNTSNGRSVVVRINDRGPYVGGRVIDLSQASARAIGIHGVAKVRVSRL
ncbi:septal ring lytic transglycosylase RlpA family protein [Methylobacterium oryzihabitans]|jgi:rare lipoprotein A|uniref:Endolytic peptidoglycan transglycosylase RlpA n=1 Tax=Methylobacterium oryzihabitans TaxID=2499852 RepID=A0A437PEJ7_9HYPH|nr:septal ring lytic transglycosylase RlpA family protein [Methylobacterium oryzihabitans]RVU20702.1 septal ring lytic transglycosylase RlpA family protein [Methylobacterium oryzihabitans]